MTAKAKGKRQKATPRDATVAEWPGATHEPRPTSHGFFVTGTDTGVGKTLVSCALLRGFAARGVRAVGMKPVASGAEPGAQGLVHADVERLIACSSVSAPRRHVNPYCFEPPVAPHVAAQRAGVTIALDPIAQAFRELAAIAQMVIVEGVGGFCVPLSPEADTSHLAVRLGLPVVLVVGLRLGCLNHALLTADAIAARGLTLAGWVANQIDPGMAEPDANVEALRQRLGAPLVARIAYAEAPDPASIGPGLNWSFLK